MCDHPPNAASQALKNRELCLVSPVLSCFIELNLSLGMIRSLSLELQCLVPSDYPSPETEANAYDSWTAQSASSLLERSRLLRLHLLVKQLSLSWYYIEAMRLAVLEFAGVSL